MNMSEIVKIKIDDIDPSFLSISTYEAVVVPLLADFIPEAVERLTDHSDSVVLFTDPEIFQKLDVKKMPKLRYTYFRSRS